MRLTTWCLALACALPAAAQDRATRKQEKARAKIAKKLGVPAEALAAVRGERYGSRDPAERRALLEAIGRRPDGALLPLLLDAARRERDHDNRVSAVRLLSVVGLEADREALAEQLLPALPKLWSDREDDVFLAAADGWNHLNRWFGLDARVAGLLERAFRGENYRLAQKAFVGLADLQHPELRAGPAREALLEVLQPKTRFSVFERKRAVLEAGRRGGLREPGELAELLFADGTVAIECAQALAELGDTSVLPALRRVDRTASHKLRIPAYEARARLDDAQLLTELDGALASDHVAIQQTLIRGLAHLSAPQTDRVLARLAAAAERDDLRDEVALAQLARGDAAALDHLRARLSEGAEKGLARRVLAVEHRVSAPLVLLLARRDALGQRGRAVDRLGAWGLGEAEEVKLLRTLAKGTEPNALRLRAAASLLQVGAAGGVAAVTSALEGLTVVAREDVKTGAGKPARRYRGSVLVDVCRRWADGVTLEAIPLLAAWLDPPLPGPAPQPAAAGGTQTGGQTDAERPAPELPAWLEHPWVRAGVVEALGRLTLDAQAVDDAARLDRGRRALARPLADPAAVVEVEALRALAALAGAAALPPAASLDEEQAAREAVTAWLRRGG